MKVKTLMQRDVAVSGPADSLSAAAHLMWDHDCGFAPVVDPETEALVGAVTDRDICMAALMTGTPIGKLCVRDVMSSPCLSCHEDDDLSVAHTLMRQHQVRRLPVVAEADVVIGILTLNDFAVEAYGGRGPTALRRQREAGKTLAAVSQHRKFEPAPTEKAEKVAG
jgi:predicted transcriptional regulator